MKKTMSREVDLGNEPVRHLLLVLAVPAITSQVVNALYNMVDRMYIGHIPEVGSTALTGVGVCFPIIMIISAFAYLMGMGGAPRASIYMGKKDNDTAEKILGNSFSALVIASIILTVTVLIFQEPLLYLFGASKNTISYAKSYMTIYAIGTIFVQLTLGMNAFISAQGFYPALRLAALPQQGAAPLAPLRGYPCTPTKTVHPPLASVPFLRVLLSYPGGDTHSHLPLEHRHCEPRKRQISRCRSRLPKRRKADKRMGRNDP